jgi:hypothetical protein
MDDDLCHGRRFRSSHWSRRWWRRTRRGKKKSPQLSSFSRGRRTCSRFFRRCSRWKVRLASPSDRSCRVADNLSSFVPLNLFFVFSRSSPDLSPRAGLDPGLDLCYLELSLRIAIEKRGYQRALLCPYKRVRKGESDFERKSRRGGVLISRLAPSLSSRFLHSFALQHVYDTYKERQHP